MKKWVDQQVKARGFLTTSEFVRHLLRAEWESDAAQEIERTPLEELEAPMSRTARRSRRRDETQAVGRARAGQRQARGRRERR